jgi:hypothetical protein
MFVIFGRNTMKAPRFGRGQKGLGQDQRRAGWLAAIAVCATVALGTGLSPSIAGASDDLSPTAAGDGCITNPFVGGTDNWTGWFNGTVASSREGRTDTSALYLNGNPATALRIVDCPGVTSITLWARTRIGTANLYAKAFTDAQPGQSTPAFALTTTYRQITIAIPAAITSPFKLGLEVYGAQIFIDDVAYNTPTPPPPPPPTGDCTANTFLASTEGWNPWFNGTIFSNGFGTGRTDTFALQLFGSPATAVRNINCPGITSITFWARTIEGTANLYAKTFTDSTAGTATPPYRLTDTYQQFTIPIPTGPTNSASLPPGPFKLGLEAYGSRQVLIDDVTYETSTPPPADSCQINDTFAGGLGQWAPWFAGTPTLSANGRRDSSAMTLDGTTKNTAIRTFTCQTNPLYITFWARTTNGSSSSPYLLFAKAFSDTTTSRLIATPVGAIWQQIVVPVGPGDNKIGIEGSFFGVEIDDVGTSVSAACRDETYEPDETRANEWTALFDGPPSIGNRPTSPLEPTSSDKVTLFGLTNLTNRPLAPLVRNTYRQSARRLITASDCPGKTIDTVFVNLLGAQPLDVTLINPATGQRVPWSEARSASFGSFSLPTIPPGGLILEATTTYEHQCCSRGDSFFLTAGIEQMTFFGS